MIRKKAAIILAAGKGKRMKSELPKVLHAINGKPMIRYLLETISRLNLDKTVVVVGHKGQMVIDEIKDFDVIIIDSPAGIESGFEHSIFLADRALIVSTPDVSAVRDADRVIGIIDAKSEKAKNGEEVLKHVIINRLKPEMVSNGNMLGIEDVLNILALPLIGVIPEDEKIITSTNKGEPIYYDKDSKAAEAYRRIAKRMLGEEVAFLDLSVKKGFFGRLFG